MGPDLRESSVDPSVAQHLQANSYSPKLRSSEAISRLPQNGVTEWFEAC
jgi:hypothetical protein